MPPENDPEQTPEGQPVDDATTSGEPAANPALSLSAEAVRNSPEFKALEKANRKLARQVGTAETAAAKARTEAEEARLAAEATQQAALEADLAALAGDEGLALWAELSDLSANDPRAAAQRLGEILQGRAQNPAPGDAPPADDGAAPAGGTEVPANTPPPPSRGLDGGAPLGAAAAGEDVDQVIAGLENTYKGVVERVQNPATRNRVTMRDRASAFIAFVGGSYLKALNQPKDR